MKYLIKQAGTEQTSYEFKGKHVYRTTTSTQPFEGAKQPNPEEKFFTKTERIKDFSEQESIKRRFKAQDMMTFKKAAGCKSKKKGKKKLKYMTKGASKYDLGRYQKIQVALGKTPIGNEKRLNKLFKLEDKLKGRIIGEAEQKADLALQAHKAEQEIRRVSKYGFPPSGIN